MWRLQRGGQLVLGTKYSLAPSLTLLIDLVCMKHLLSRWVLLQNDSQRLSWLFMSTVLPLCINWARLMMYRAIRPGKSRCPRREMVRAKTGAADSLLHEFTAFERAFKQGPILS